MRDRLDAVGRLADHRELRPLVEHLAERVPHRRVIVDDENPERAGGGAGMSSRVPPVRSARGSDAPRGCGRCARAARREQMDRVPRPGALSMSTRPPSSVSRSRMLKSPQPTWPAFDRSSSSAGEADAVVVTVMQS